VTEAVVVVNLLVVVLLVWRIDERGFHHRLGYYISSS
jgi:hypothetical protein